MKRFLVGLMSVTLAAGAVFGMSRGSPSIVTATPSVQTSTVQPGLPGGPRQNDGTRAGGQVASVSGNTVTVKTRDGASQSIVTSDGTTVTLDGSASTLSALAAGQFIRATGTTDSAGAFTATSIEASTTPPQGRPGGPGGPDGQRQNDGTRAGGQVASVSGNTVTVKTRDGASQSIVTSDSTTVTLDGSASNVSALAAGQFIRATGTTDSVGAFTATSIEASTTPPQGRPGGPGGPDGQRQNDGTRAGGQVASVNGNTVTVKTRDGASQSIVATDSTTVTLDGSASTLSALAAGQFIRATGTTDSAGAFTATSIEASTTPPQGRPGGPRP